MSSRRHLLWLVCLAVVQFRAPVYAQDANGVFGAKHYLKDVQPLLKARCYACHGALKQEAGLRLDTGAAVRKGSENGPVISEDATDSELLKRIRSTEDDRMPPEGKPLTPDEVTAISEWVANGAEAPQGEVPEESPADHWAFQKPTRPDVPALSDWSSHPLDRFIQRRHKEHGLKAAPAARPAHLLRRLALDLTGLPPAPATLKSFEQDPSDENYQRIVTRYLESPQYGERWARHWMDVWRYSDWYGRRQQNDVRNSAPQIWRWRDWIIQSLNDDKGYGRMIQEMLAADEIAPEDDSAWPATGYLIRNYYSLNPNEWMRHNVEYTGKAFLGLTFNCAHCHDHKYDPIAHDDYFRFRAFFEPIGIRQDRVVGEAEPPPFEVYKYGGSRKVVRTGMVRVFDERPDAPTWFYTGGDERNRVKERDSIPPGVPAFLGVPFEPVARQHLPASGWYPGARKNLQQWLVDEARQSLLHAESRRNVEANDKPAKEKIRAKLAAAELELDEAIKQSAADGSLRPIAGRQSLHLQTADGRRILQHDLSDMKSLPDGATIEFQLQVLKSGHFNFQLARDAQKHLTALYLGFVDGRVRAYRPGTFTEFDFGQYQQGPESQVIEVRLVLHPAKDVAVVMIAQRNQQGDSEPVVAGEPIALNGWNPTIHKHQPITLDCREHTDVFLDDLQIVAGEQTWRWNFETPEFAAGYGAEGHSGWVLHAQSRGVASSQVEIPSDSPAVQKACNAVAVLRNTLRATELSNRVHELRYAAAQKRLDGLLAVINADGAAGDSKSSQNLSRTAAVKQYEASLADLKFQQVDARLQISQLSVGDAAKNKDAISELQKRLDTATQELAKITAAGASEQHARLSPVYSKTSTGRRKSLARWITHKDNPLTPRVAINHIWLRHFHRPLVESVYDFGRNGKRPTHPDLLDWLAVEFLEHNWSMKHIHRLIVTSKTYRISSSVKGREDSYARDEDNHWLWRMNTGRMEAEVVRDSVLAIAGQLDLTVGGPVLAASTAPTTRRRSLYYEVYPEEGGSLPEATPFDPPDPGECFRRTTTVVPQQALALSNSKLIHVAAAETVKVIDAESPDSASWVRLAFVHVLSRSPTEAEYAISTRFLGQSPVTDRKQAFVRVLFNHNDFVSVR